MKWLIEFYVIVDLGIICKRVIIKFVLKTYFLKRKIWIIFLKKIKGKHCIKDGLRLNNDVWLEKLDYNQ